MNERKGIKITKSLILKSLIKESSNVFLLSITNSTPTPIKLIVHDEDFTA